MTTLLTTHDVAAIAARTGLPEMLRQMVRYLEADFRRWPEFEKSARLASHSEVGVIELMPVADANEYSFKYVNGHPKNTREGLPTVMAFGVLADVATGAPTLLSELTLTTALRTAATSVMAASVLARPDARSMALIGNGAQAEFQTLAFHYLLGIDEIRLFDVDQAATSKLLGHLTRVPGLRLKVCGSTAEAVRGADIVTTVTADKTNATILTPAMIEPGMHVNGVGGDCPGKTELHAEVLRRSRVFVEFEPQTRIEGDLQQMPADFPVTELWTLLVDPASFQRSPDDVTVFDSVGFALEDYSALRLLRDFARQYGIGEQIPLIAAPTNPKDLYGELLRLAPAKVRAA
ncbi:ornithine cyclodeaminase [Pseudomarimonas salicorniae]|uniref:Ornithine cyclodeaminase n=1 Tax=Pseudomarimonas salicorniae TaxID=2933270 RepID=A0ABT0GJI5_9GAMM|nr:ornithine cyclodeaminase [Lysobacter sp. CAU 1642]MCK7594192.1 ornithine cyclodeaminase [Lysobacter sp. CAU 1642]